MNDLLFSPVTSRFASVMMVICNVLYVAVLFTQSKRMPLTSTFKVYACATLLQDAVCYFGGSIEMVELSVYGTTYLETLISYTFLYYIFEKSSEKQNIILFGKVFTILSTALLTLLLTFGKTRDSAAIDYYVVLCAFINLAPSFYYIYRLVLSPDITKLKRDPSFWMAATYFGCSCMSACFRISSFCSRNLLSTLASADNPSNQTGNSEPWEKQQKILFFFPS